MNTSRGMSPSCEESKLQSTHIMCGALPSREVYNSVFVAHSIPGTSCWLHVYCMGECTLGAVPRPIKKLVMSLGRRTKRPTDGER